MGFYDSLTIEQLKDKRAGLCAERFLLVAAIESINSGLGQYPEGSAAQIRALDACKHKMRALRAIDVEVKTINKRVRRLATANGRPNGMFDLLLKAVRLRFGETVAGELLREAHGQREAIQKFQLKKVNGEC